MKLKELYESEERSILSVMGQQPEKVDGDFWCSGKLITSLEGAPKEVDRHFYCHRNQLTSLEGGPQKVGGDFMCSSNELTSLKGAPQKVDADFYCADNKLTSLIGGPHEVGEDFYCHSNKLTSLIGAPQKVGEDFYCSSNQLTNLKDIHKHIKSIGGEADFEDNSIESHVAGLLLIEGLKRVYLDSKKVETIINKHLKADRDVFACIDELEEAGFPEFAQI